MLKNLTAEKWQAIRSSLYALSGSIIGVLGVLGVIGGVEDDIAFVDMLFNASDNIVGALLLFVAWEKSRPSRVSVIEAPLRSVEAYTADGGILYAGPASSFKTGAVLVDPSVPEDEHLH